MHFFFDVQPEEPRLRAFTATTLELDEEEDDEDVLELELDEPEAGASEAPELLSSFFSSEFEGSSSTCIILCISYVLG